MSDPSTPGALGDEQDAREREGSALYMRAVQDVMALESLRGRVGGVVEAGVEAYGSDPLKLRERAAEASAIHVAAPPPRRKGGEGGWTRRSYPKRTEECMLDALAAQYMGEQVDFAAARLAMSDHVGFSVPEATAQSTLATLTARGVLERSGKRPNFLWRLPPGLSFDVQRDAEAEARFAEQAGLSS